VPARLLKNEHRFCFESVLFGSSLRISAVVKEVCRLARVAGVAFRIFARYEEEYLHWSRHRVTISQALLSFCLPIVALSSLSLVQFAALVS